MHETMECGDSSSLEKAQLFDEQSVASMDTDDTLAELDQQLYSTSSSASFSTQKWINALRPTARAVRSTPWRSLMGRFAVALLPSFVQSRLCREETKPERTYPTAYLDGMRGLAALFVFFCHYSYGVFCITRGWGYESDDGHVNNYFFQLPFIRLFYSGPPMVCIFFVISGYALSLKPVKLMRARSFDTLSTTMASSIFRRGMRLFIPCIISTFMVLLLAWYGFFEATRKFSEDASFFPAIREYHQPRFETFNEQFYDWLERTFQFIHVWDFDPFGGSTGYDLHLWTIPLEFRASMVLFLVQIGLSKAKTWVRWSCLYGFAWFCHRHGRWDILLFTFGLFFAEIDVVRAARRKLNSPSASPLPTSIATFEKPSGNYNGSRAFKQYFWLAIAGFGLFLMSSPDDQASATPGYMYLSTLIPEQFTSHKYRYWQSVGSILFVLATNFSPILQRPFNSDVVQYFGKISYAIYLVHGPILHTAGYTIMRWAWSITGNDSEGQHVAGFALATIFVVPVVVWAADLFWRFVDAPTVKFAKWVEEKCDAGDADKR